MVKKQKRKKSLGRIKAMKLDRSKRIEPLILDKTGFFLIGKWGKRIRVAFCSYDRHIRDRMINKDPKKILKWIKDNGYTGRKDHYAYMQRELKKVKKCIKENKAYVQP